MSIERTLEGSIKAYGSEIGIIRSNGTSGSTKGFIQPVTYKNASRYYQEEHSAVSSSDKTVYIFLGSPDAEFSVDDRLSLNGNLYTVTSREKYIFKNTGLYVRAVLRKYLPPQEDDYDDNADTA